MYLAVGTMERHFKDKRATTMLTTQRSYEVFKNFVTKDSEGNVHVEALLTKECFQEWMKSRNVIPKFPEESFRKAITSHCK